MNVRAATVGDAAAITHIYNDGIASGRSTFETELRTAAAPDVLVPRFSVQIATMFAKMITKRGES
jgi:L-amino acid N-acyltransferase YncA